jgi:TolB-like protein/Flp pilus assembly protein TadD
MIFEFESCRLDSERRELWRDGDLVAVEPGVFDLLEYLILNRDRVVAKDDLIAAVWKGYVVSPSAISGRLNAARTAICDTGEAQRLIRTLPRKGFRFIAPVREVPRKIDVTLRPVSSPDPGVLQGAAAPRLPDKPSIAVLPFANISGDAMQDYFVDGITEDLITELSRMRWFLVMARNSSFAYKGQAIDVKRVGRELDVRYILQGSVRKVGRRVRISAQLVDATTGGHIWVERYDRRLTDMLAVQDEITARVAAAIEPTLLAIEGLRAEARSVVDLDAWDLVARALWHYWKMTAERIETTIKLLSEAVTRYPNYAPAHSSLAWALAYATYVGWRPAGLEHEKAKALARRALELDEQDPRAYQSLGLLAVLERQTDEAVRYIKIALDLNPNFTAAYRTLVLALVLGGRSEEALRYADEAAVRSPRDETRLMMCIVAGANYFLGRYGQAVKCAKEGLERRPHFMPGHRILCASLAQAGKIEEARVAMARLRELHPGISIAWVRKRLPHAEAEMEHFVEGLRKAGMPER